MKTREPEIAGTSCSVAVYLWTDKRYVACLLTKSACSFSYMRTRLECLLAGEGRLFPDDVSDTCSRVQANRAPTDERSSERSFKSSGKKIPKKYYVTKI